MLEVIDPAAARRWAITALVGLGRAREEIDALNVYPVPDGDTGTNLYLTVEAACDAVRAVPASADTRQVLEAFARGALLGARGNSGIIVASMLRGWAHALAEGPVLDGPAVKKAARQGDDAAWSAVARPEEGTILSVSRAGAQAAEAAGDALADVVAAMLAAARQALEHTTEQLPALTRAGVVDAGGRGYVVLLEALDDVVHARPPSVRSRRLLPAGTSPAAQHPAAPLVTPPVTSPAVMSPAVSAEAAFDGRTYEVMFLLEQVAAEDDLVPLRARLEAIGDSLVVVGGPDLWHVHVHVDDAGAAIEAALEVGRPRQVRITHFADVVRSRAAAPPATAVGLVACAAGPGLAELFTQAGAVVVRTEPGRRPSTGEILDAVRAVAAAAVVVLPNDPDTQAVAEAAAAVADEDGLRVTVLPTRAQVQGLAAAAVHDPTRRVADDVVRMSAAAGAARDGAVTVAVRDAITTAGVCRAGDALGVVQGDFAVIGDDLAVVAVEVVDRLLSGGGELVTLVRGLDATDPLVDAVVEHVRRSRLEVEVQVLDGGQPRYPLLIGVE